MSFRGVLLFGRFAFPPNQLGYCGPADHAALLDYVSEESPDQGMVELGRRFEGAYPYLNLIAHANGSDDPFDERVVEAYWIGNSLLRGVDGRALYGSLRDRFSKRIPGPQFEWLVPKLEAGAHPHHNFHVFDVTFLAGHGRQARTTVTLPALDSCRISWGKVVAIEADQLVLRRRPLESGAQGLRLGAVQTVKVAGQLGGRALAGRVELGDTVAVHWGWACSRLDQRQLAALRVATADCLAWANQTM